MKTMMIAGWCLMALVLTSCHKDTTFNQSDYDGYVKTKFGISNVSSSQRWVTVKTATASVSINESEAGTYQVGVYASDPTASTVTRPCVALLEQKVQNVGYVFRPFNYPAVLNRLYVSVVSPSNRRQVKQVMLNSGMLTCAFTDADATTTAHVTSKPFTLRYCFEENFPDAGDFDFNDLVLSLRPEVNDKTLTLHVTLDAVGGQKAIAAAIRLTEVSSSDLTSYSVTQGFPSPDGQGLGEYNNIETSETILMENTLPNYSQNVAIVLFKDAHWAIHPEKASTGGVLYTCYNTVLPSSETAMNYINVPAREAVYSFEFKTAEKAQAMLRQDLYDVFVVTPYNGTYWETHLVQNDYKLVQVLTPFKPDGYEAAYGDNTPWALLLPGTFSYPVEGTHIAAAYGTTNHSFVDWAVYPLLDTDWYNFPLANKVYE